MPAKVMLAMPMRPGEMLKAGAAVGFYGYTCYTPNVSVTRCQSSSSILPLTFDMLWSQALNHADRGEATHFAMQHDDVVPDRDWLGTLLRELEANDADIVSAVVPLKDDRGLTSTAIDDTGDVWNPRRLTLAEVFELPETFTDPDILLNTGLWVCDLSRPWCRAERDGVLACSFHQRNRIVRGPAGWTPETRSEDWEFSRLVRAAGGVRQYATRAVGLCHDHPGYHTRGVWGTCTRDPLAPPLEPVGV